MAFLSYAQNFEDVMLWRALGHIPNGLYVDVGAQHPRIDSVSRAFYEHGWRGVHIEPVPEFARLLRLDRPDETVLQTALGATEGTLELSVFADTGLSTAVTAFADRHIAERDYAVERIQVPVLTLTSALSALAGREVHWLKIDVEGFEEQVLRGWDSTLLRPWVMVVEATLPNLPDTDFAGWDPILVAANYTFVYFDGLNRFYVAAEHAELVAAFAAPPNVFDATELSGLASWGLARPIIEQRDTAVAQLAGLADQARRANDEQALTAELLRQSKSHTADLTAELASITAALAALERTLEDERAQGRHLQREGEVMARELARMTVEVGERDRMVFEHGRLLGERQQVETLLNSRLSTVIAERNVARAKVDELNQQVAYWWSCADFQVTQLAKVYDSRSWRVSAPLRTFSALARRMRDLAGHIKRKLVRHAAQVPGASWIVPAGDAGQATAPGATRKLSPHAESVYADLKQAVSESR